MDNVLTFIKMDDFKFPEDTNTVPRYLMMDKEGYLHLCYVNYYRFNDTWVIMDTETGDYTFTVDEMVGFIPLSDINMKIPHNDND